MNNTVTKNERAHGRDKGRVLLVSDDADTAMVTSAFERAGFVLVGVTSGAGALVQVHRSRPHVVVAGANPKGITSGELVRLLASAKDHVPFVLIGSEASSVLQRSAAMNSGAFDYFSIPDELKLLLSRVNQLVSITQAMELLKSEADRDYLTGLANRRRFRSALGQEVERWRRYKLPCSLLIADIDHLKVINDTFGHTAGDVAIRHVAGLLNEFSRDNDTAARLGGEEFALLLAGVEYSNALAAAERIRENISAEILEKIGKVTVSIGVGSCPSNAISERELYAACDTALYRAKREGRNRSCVAELLAAT